MVTIALLKSRSVYISITLSVISVITTTAINIQIAGEYLRVDGKTKALFGVKEILQFSYQYYVCILGLAAIIFAIKSNGKPTAKTMALIFGLSTIFFAFLRVWRLFI